MRGYSLGAVDYLNKPVVPEVLQAKVSAFVELYKKTEQIKQQAELLRELQQREHEREFASARMEWKAQSERDTEEVRQKFMAILEATPDLVAIISPDFSPQYVNRAGRRILGLADGADVTKLQLSDLRLLQEVLTQAVREGMWRGETEFVDPAGRAVPVSQLILAHKNSAGAVEFYSTIARDLTEHKELEQQLRQAQKLEGIGQLAGGIAHDFNNLLTVILGRSQMLQSKLKPNSPLRRDADLIFRTGERASALTRQLLAFGRKQVLQPRILDLNTVTADMEKMLRRLIGEHIELFIVPHRDLGQVKADPGQIEQVIMNLAVNARDAMPSGGKLTIETANVELDRGFAARHAEVQPGRYVMLAVSDTGFGMTPEIQAHIFEPFFTTKEEGKGTGLGLATVYGIVKQTDGNIWVYTEPNRGTTFKIFLPRIDAAVDEPQHHLAAAGFISGSETILLVEDDEAVRENTEDILKEAGYTVLVSRDVEHARMLGAQHDGPIHLMLSDVVMPRMKGPELARLLLSARPEMKVLLVSGYTDASVVDHGVLDPEIAFLQKPFAADVLLAKVRETLGTARI